jgi:clan AA aspartic protease (TIGR02281 family)
MQRNYTKLLGAALAASLMLATIAGVAVAGPEEEYRNAVAADQRHDYAAAARILRPLADQGYMLAQFRLGFMYYFGRGVPQSDAESARWYRKAAEQGHAGSQSSLGSHYLLGDGVRQNYAEAAKWFLKAAKQGDAGAQHFLGRIYQRGLGVPQNYILAYKWFTVAAHDPDYEAAVKDELDTIVPHMAPSQIAEAQRLAQGCLYNYADCDVQTPQVAGREKNGAPSTAPTQNPSFRTGVQLKMDGGIFVVAVEINGTMTLDFAIDSGASDVSVPADVFSALKRRGTIKESDFIGKRTYVLADGSKLESVTFRIRSLRVGDMVVENVRGSVASSQGSLLLGQSFLERFKSWSIDNTKHEILLEPR